MDPIAPVAVIVTIGALYFSIRKRRNWRKALSALATERGWSFNRGGILTAAEVIGFEGIRTITVTAENRGENVRATVVKIVSPLNEIESIGTEGFASSLKRMVGGEDVQLGIPDLDARWLLRGEPRSLLARLGSENTPAIQDFLDRGGRVGDDGVYLATMGYLTNYMELLDFVGLAHAASHILDPENPNDDEQLLANVASGSTADNRRRCFEAIADEEIRDQAAQVMLEDADPNNRIAGAVCAQRGDLLKAMLTESSGLDLETRLEGVSGLSRFDMDAAKEALSEIGSHQDGAFEKVLLLAAQIGLVLPLSSLKTMAVEGDLKVRRALSGTLRPHGPAAESALLTLLADPDDSVAAGAAEALTAVGTLAAVHPLMQRSDGILRGGEIKKTARDAIASIQVRHGGSDRGGLALADEELGGGLAVVDDGGDSAP